MVLLQSLARHLRGEHEGARSGKQLPQPGLPSDDQYKWRPEVFLIELYTHLLVDRGSSIPAVIRFMASFKYSAFYADGQLGELTEAAEAAVGGKLPPDFQRRDCNNYVFVADQVDPSMYLNPNGCKE